MATKVSQSRGTEGSSGKCAIPRAHASARHRFLVDPDLARLEARAQLLERQHAVLCTQQNATQRVRSLAPQNIHMSEHRRRTETKHDGETEGGRGTHESQSTGTGNGAANRTHESRKKKEPEQQPSESRLTLLTSHSSNSCWHTVPGSPVCTMWFCSAVRSSLCANKGHQREGVQCDELQQLRRRQQVSGAATDHRIDSEKDAFTEHRCSTTQKGHGTRGGSVQDTDKGPRQPAHVMRTWLSSIQSRTDARRAELTCGTRDKPRSGWHEEQRSERESAHRWRNSDAAARQPQRTPTKAEW